MRKATKRCGTLLRTVVLALVSVGSLCVAPLAIAAPDPETLTFAPADDATIRASSPNSVYGARTSLEVDNDSEKHSLLKFVVNGVDGRQVLDAKLRIYNVDSSREGGDWYELIDNSWQEETVTWNTAPIGEPSLPIASLGRVDSGNWYEISLTSLVDDDGIYGLKGKSTSSNGADYTSKEGASGFGPQLVITAGTPPPDDSMPPSPPTGLSGTASGSNTVDLNWTAATDNIGVTGYNIYRDGLFLSSIGNLVQYTDSSAVAERTYDYTVRALDASGNISEESNTATVTTPVEDPTGQPKQWFKSDLHIHSVVSADAYPDLGILSSAAQAAGYNALFVTDHNRASDFPISGLTANHMEFEDSYTRWTKGTFGTASSTTNTLSNTPVNTGSKSLHLAAGNSSGSGEAFVWAARGPNFRSGDIVVDVSINPKRIDVGSGVYFSAAVGGDPRVRTDPVGYTTEDGISSQGKSTLLVWQLGSARSPSSTADRRVLTYSLPYTIDQWNHYTINVSDALADIPAADRPLDHNAVTHLKMAAAANGGTADAYFDSYSIDASAPQSSAEEFIYRNGLLPNYDTAAFRMHPGVEMGVRKHAQRFNFGITDPIEFTDFFDGIDGIIPTQQTGYPSMLNHPGSSGGVEAAEAISTGGYGADLVEADKDSQLDTWDEILKQGTQILGIGSTDKHTASYSLNSSSTYIYSPSLQFDFLARSLFEGNTFINGNGNFTGPLAFNLDGSIDPYPARYPTFVPDTRNTQKVYLSIPSDLENGWTVRWIRNGNVIATDSISASSYNAVKDVSLSGSQTYIRAEVRSSSGSLRAATQPIFFTDISGLPSDKSFRVQQVETDDGKGYTKYMTKGVASSNWNSGSETLTFTLDNKPQSMAQLHVESDEQAEQLVIDGIQVPSAASLAEFESATESSWFYDSAAKTLFTKILQGSSSTTVEIAFAPPAIDNQAPSDPSGLAATAVSGERVDLSWVGSIDNVGVVGYDIYRDGSFLTAVGDVTTASDTTVVPNASYSYFVQARDAAGNVSGMSNIAMVTTPPISELVFPPSDDTYVREDDPTSNFGSRDSLAIDNRPVKHTLFKFVVSGIGLKRVVSAKLRLFNVDHSRRGGDFYRVLNTSWTEGSVTWNTAPAGDPLPVATLGRVSSGNWYEVDVTSLVASDGPLALKVTSTSSNGADYASKESANGPELVVTLE